MASSLSEGEGSEKEKDHDEGQMPDHMVHIELSSILLSRFLVLSLDSYTGPSDSDRDSIWLDRRSSIEVADYFFFPIIHVNVEMIKLRATMNLIYKCKF